MLGDTADDNKSPLGLNALLNSLIKLANPCLSDSGPALQSTCINNYYYKHIHISKPNPKVFYYIYILVLKTILLYS